MKTKKYYWTNSVVLLLVIAIIGFIGNEMYATNTIQKYYKIEAITDLNNGSEHYLNLDILYFEPLQVSVKSVEVSYEVNRLYHIYNKVILRREGDQKSMNLLKKNSRHRTEVVNNYTEEILSDYPKPDN